MPGSDASDPGQGLRAPQAPQAGRRGPNTSTAALGGTARRSRRVPVAAKKQSQQQDNISCKGIEKGVGRRTTGPDRTEVPGQRRGRSQSVRPGAQGSRHARATATRAGQGRRALEPAEVRLRGGGGTRGRGEQQQARSLIPVPAGRLQEAPFKSHESPPSFFLSLTLTLHCQSTPIHTRNHSPTPPNLAQCPTRRPTPRPRRRA